MVKTKLGYLQVYKFRIDEQDLAPNSNSPEEEKIKEYNNREKREKERKKKEYFRKLMNNKMDPSRERKKR